MQEEDEWPVPYWSNGLKRKYKPSDLEWLQEHRRLMPYKNLVNWFNHYRGHSYTERSMLNILKKHGLTKTRYKKQKGKHNVICLKKFLKG